MECTTIAIGNKGTVDGSTLVSYNADCSECDWRINKVPRMSYPLGSQRPVYLLKKYKISVQSNSPRYSQ